MAERFTPMVLQREPMGDIVQKPSGICRLLLQILTVAMGANMREIRQPDTVITGCTDWLRPLIIEVERMDNA